MPSNAHYACMVLAIHWRVQTDLVFQCTTLAREVDSRAGGATITALTATADCPR